MVEPSTNQIKKRSNTLLIVSVLILIGGGVFVGTQTIQLIVISNVASMCDDARLLGGLISEKNQIACSYILDEQTYRQILFVVALGILIFGAILIIYAIHKRKE